MFHIRISSSLIYNVKQHYVKGVLIRAPFINDCWVNTYCNWQFCIYNCWQKRQGHQYFKVIHAWSLIYYYRYPNSIGATYVLTGFGIHWTNVHFYSRVDSIKRVTRYPLSHRRFPTYEFHWLLENSFRCYFVIKFGIFPNRNTFQRYFPRTK